MVAVSSAFRFPQRSIAFVFVASYLVAFNLSERAYGSLAVPSPVWLPASVLLCALLVATREAWWFFLATIWPVRLLAGAVPGTPPWFQLVTIAIDSGKAFGAAWWIQRSIGRRAQLDTLNQLLVFFGVAAAAVPLLSAAVAAPA